MRAQSCNSFRARLALLFKFGSVCMLFLVSILVVACGNTPPATGLGSPPVTLTINLNQTFASPTPTLPPYSCAAWATQSTPAYYQNSVEPVYAKFVQDVKGNPVGMNQANAIATVLWPAGAPSTIPETTTSDGLAVFMIPLQPSAVGHETLVAVSFTSQDGRHTCDVSGSQDAFFVAVIGTPVAKPTSPNGGGNPGASPTAGGGFPPTSTPGFPGTPPTG